MTIPRHLGGHANITHIDKGSLLYLKNKFDVAVMLDVGCGVGGMVQEAKNHGIMSFGVDGDYEVQRPIELLKHVIIHDYTKGNFPLDFLIDMIWSVEFLEHVEEQYLPYIFDTFKKSFHVFCTANAGGGHHHVNRQPVEYWINKFEENGFKFLKKETEEVRLASTMKRNFVRDTGMIFKNRNL